LARFTTPAGYPDAPVSNRSRAPQLHAPWPARSVSGSLPSRRMSRFASSQDAAFRALNDSISFDVRLAPYDVAQSKAHAATLAARGIISEAERDELLSGLGRVEAELRGGSFAVADGDED